MNTKHIEHIQNVIQFAERCIRDEAEALIELIPQLDSNFDRAVNMMVNCKGKVIVTGVGKSGHIGAKIAATLSSTGTPSFFINPLDVFHGDLGVMTKDDVVLALSNSGQTDELLRFIPLLQHMNVPIISMTGNPDSLLAKYSDAHILVHVKKEACPLNLAPTSSTTAALAMGDALAMTLAKAKNFTRNEFAVSHPAGRLGKRLLMKVSDVMRTGDDLPVLSPTTPIREAILCMSNKTMGMVLIADETQHLLGIFTDGDLRRVFEKYDNIAHLSLSEVMSTHPKTTTANTSAEEALNTMLQYNITVLAVIDTLSGCLKGAVSLYDIQREGL